MKQHIISLILLVGVSACVDEANDTNNQTHIISWSDGARTASALLQLYQDGTATIIVDSPDRYFLHRKETVFYKWSETDSTFILQHSDNGLVMEYRIIYRDENLRRLSYQGEMFAEIRKASPSHIVN